MDKIQKALNKLSAKEKQLVKMILRALNNAATTGLNVQKLKGHADIFRIRKGAIRIIYRKKNGEIFVLAIERRTEKTYRDF